MGRYGWAVGREERRRPIQVFFQDALDDGIIDGGSGGGPLAGSFHAVVTVVPGEFKQAQAGVVGLFVKDLGCEHSMEDSAGSTSNFL